MMGPKPKTHPCLCTGTYKIVQRDGKSWCQNCGMSVDHKVKREISSMAMDIVIDYVNNRVPKELSSLLPVRVALDEVIVVKLTNIWGNWTALLRTTLEDGLEFEVTFDRGAATFSVDVYRKIDQLVLQKAELFPGE